MNIIILILLGVVLLFLAVSFVMVGYYIYQLKRNQAVYTIRKNWINTDQLDRLEKHTYEYMFDPNLKNWFGMRYPKDKHYT
jgi:hypothetical protein